MKKRSSATPLQCRLLSYQSGMLADIRALDPFLALELQYHKDLLPDSPAAVYAGKKLVAVGFLMRNPQDRYLALEFSVDPLQALSVEAAGLLFEKLITCFLSYRERTQEDLILRLWAGEEKKYYREFLETLGFTPQDRMWTYERDLTDIEAPAAEPKIVSVDLLDDEVRKEYLAATKEAFGAEDSGNEMLFRICHCRAQVLALAIEGKPVSFVTLWPGGNGTSFAATENIFCRQAWRRQGYTKALLQGVLFRLKEEGFLRARLNVYAQDQPAVALYESLGYRRTGTLLEYHKSLE